jgi:hypothetical protein
MRDYDLDARDEEGEETEGGHPVSDADKHGWPVRLFAEECPVWGDGSSHFGRIPPCEPVRWDRCSLKIVRLAALAGDG